MNSLDQMHLCGWLDIPERHTVAAEFPTLLQVAMGCYRKAFAAGTDPVLLYKAYQDAIGKPQPDYPAQQIGDCVSFGHGHGADLLQAIEIALGEPTAWKETDTEYIYAASRKIGGMLGGGDGSYGSAAVKAMTTGGFVTREMLQADGAYSGSRARQWGRSGPPAAVEALAAKFKLGGAALVSTKDDLVAAIGNGYPVTVCSNQGFTGTRDNQGFCRASGHWGHCMVIAGIRFDRPGACILQSWGPATPSGPLDLGQPTFSFWADMATVESMLRAGDSWALSKAPDFAPRPLPDHWNWSDAA